MRKLIARFLEWLKWRRISRAEALVSRYGYAVYLRLYVADAEARAVALSGYAVTTGHLTRAYHAGKIVQRESAEIFRLLSAARDAARQNPQHIGPVVVGALVGLLGAMLTRGGTRSF
jgi:hypothetical protein